MAVTLRDVAKKAGYSVTTVSRALNGFDDVNEDTRRHIEDVARDLGYTPNLAARHLKTRRANTLGFVVPAAAERVNEPFFTELLSALSVEAARHGYDLLISAQAPDDHELDTHRRLAQSGRVDGIMLMRVRHDDPRVDLLEELDFPFVAFGRTDDPSGYAWIDVDGTAGVRAATKHLLDQGHTRIAYISGPPQYSFVQRRQRGYEEALRDAGIPLDDDLIVSVEHLVERDGYEAAKKLLSHDERPSAIVAATDLVAYGAMRAVHTAGLTVGRDVAMVGFDGLASSAYTTPPLTTVRQSITDIGHRLVDMLLSIIEMGDSRQPQILLEPSLVVRESSTGVTQEQH